MSHPYTKGVHEVGDGVHAYLQPDGSWGLSNAGLVVDGEASLLVDTLFDLTLTGEMLGELRRATPAADHIDVVVNTHANGDHCWGNQLVRNAEIVGSVACAEEMGEVSPELIVSVMANVSSMGPAGVLLARMFGAFDFSDIELTPPTRTFEGELTLQVGDTEVQLMEVGPAHTRGDVVVSVPSAGVVFTGDILFNGGHPIVWAGPVANWIAACDRILALDPATVVPGHGPVCGTEAVAAQRDYFAFLTDEVRPRFDAGMAPLEAARDIDLGPYADWTERERFVANVAAVFRDLGGSVPSDAVTVLGQMAEYDGGA